jgi:alanyl-tRNA synthetase
MDAQELRRAFIGFFVERGHTEVASSSLIPHHHLAPLFTNAGMNQFIGYFLGEETPPFSRAVSVQKCVRIRGKHDDIELAGRTDRHLTFFEMLGNFSFGDYFKREAIRWAWEFLTSALRIEPERIWATIHPSDEEARVVWLEEVGLSPFHLGETEENFWDMGEVGPCGPCSEIHVDRGEAYGRGGGPLHGDEARYPEIWNLVFTQFDRREDGSLADLPRRNIDTGAGLERLLMVLEGVSSVWETSLLAPLVDRARQLVGQGSAARGETSLRIIADHARAVAFLVADGVYPSNYDRGYVLRRLIRRAVREGVEAGVSEPFFAEMVSAVAALMSDAYPSLASEEDFLREVVDREERRFRETLRAGMVLFDQVVAAGSKEIPGEVAFRLHDTHGLPIELVREIAAERGLVVDEAGFAQAMEEQRARARRAAKSGAGADSESLRAYQELLETFGTTSFVGYSQYQSEAKVLAVLERPDGLVEIFLDRTPFYAESGGQVGDTGYIETESGRARVLDTTQALPLLHRHLARLEAGAIYPGQLARAVIEAERREAIRRNHTGTHMIHWALREVLGEHVRQQGSLVAPERLRFDFSHHQAVGPKELAKAEDLVNAEVLADLEVRVEEMSREEAEAIGALAFFGERYGDRVRVVRAGSGSLELCGGTHVDSLGMIGLVRIVSESSIAAGTRRIEAVTGWELLRADRRRSELLERAAEALGVSPEEVPARIEEMRLSMRRIQEEAQRLRDQLLARDATELAAAARDGIVVVRRDGLDRDAMRSFAMALRNQRGIKAVAIGGSPDGKGVALVVAAAEHSGVDAAAVASLGARVVGGGGGGDRRFAFAGGRDISRLDDALEQMRRHIEQQIAHADS